jgi:hypothetical protein
MAFSSNTRGLMLSSQTMSGKYEDDYPPTTDQKGLPDSRRPIFIATLRAGANWLFFRPAAAGGRRTEAQAPDLIASSVLKSSPRPECMGSTFEPEATIPSGVPPGRIKMGE